MKHGFDKPDLVLQIFHNVLFFLQSLYDNLEW